MKTKKEARDGSRFKQSGEGFFLSGECPASCTADTMAKHDEETQKVIKAGVIQNFEFSYELCWKFIQRWMRENRTAEEADYPHTRKELFRMAAPREGLIAGPLPWFEYSDVRNLVAHMYNQENAEKVFQTAIRFMNDTKKMGFLRIVLHL